VLADRIAARDPGNAPASGERIGYVYVQALAGQIPSKLQGERVETPDWIVKNRLKTDAEYYINHQLYNPLAQLFGLMVEKMPGFVGPAKWAEDVDKRIGQREAIAGDLLFRDGLAYCQNAAKHAFVKILGSSSASPSASTASASASTSTRRMRAPPVNKTLAEAEAVIKTPKKQTLISAFAMQTALSVDERMAREMRAIKYKK
jgi:hypothetical protein